MKSHFLFFVVLSVFFASCEQAVHPDLYEQMQTELAETKAALEAANVEIEALKDAPEQLVHIVWFKLKSDADREELIKEIKSLKAIEVLNDLTVGEFHDLGDSRAMSDLDVVMSMKFNSEPDYQTYQAHELHLKLKENAGKYLTSPPVTYDFWTK